MEKFEALAKFLECESEDIDDEGNDETYKYGRREYLVLTDSEADAMCASQIKDSAWAFNPEFLRAHMTKGVTVKALQAIQADCEDCNDVILALIKDVDHFVNDAISSDGRGHFLSQYDGEENEVGEYFIYRTN